MEFERRKRVHRAASPGLVPEDVPAWLSHREASLLRRDSSSNAGLGTEERSPEEREQLRIAKIARKRDLREVIEELRRGSREKRRLLRSVLRRSAVISRFELTHNQK